MNLNRFAKSAVAGSVALAHLAGSAAPYDLVQTPRGAGFKEPAPNVIVSIDNSTSMRYSSNAADGDIEPPEGTATRLKALKTALSNNFSVAAIPDGQIRLAWQAMNNVTISDTPSCVGFNGAHAGSSCAVAGTAGANLMQPLQGEHRQNFLSWVDGLELGPSTPAHATMTRAGDL